jgi:hypothetical protein
MFVRINLVEGDATYVNVNNISNVWTEFNGARKGFHYYIKMNNANIFVTDEEGYHEVLSAYDAN